MLRWNGSKASKGATSLAFGGMVSAGVFCLTFGFMFDPARAAPGRAQLALAAPLKLMVNIANF
jgi:hypothetical protein